MHVIHKIISRDVSCCATFLWCCKYMFAISCMQCTCVQIHVCKRMVAVTCLQSHACNHMHAITSMQSQGCSHMCATTCVQSHACEHLCAPGHMSVTTCLPRLVPESTKAIIRLIQALYLLHIDLNVHLKPSMTHLV